MFTTKVFVSPRGNVFSGQEVFVSRMKFIYLAHHSEAYHRGKHPVNTIIIIYYFEKKIFALTYYNYLIGGILTVNKTEGSIPHAKHFVKREYIIYYFTNYFFALTLC